ncbi:MAG: anti-sigma factor [Gemmatimonadales bacterium]
MTDHEWLEAAGPYALGVLDREERTAFEAHLAGCVRCRAEVQAFQEVAGLLAHGAPAAAPPAGLRDRVLAEARQVRPIGRRGTRVPWLAAAAALVVALGAGAGAWRTLRRVAALEREIAARDSALAVFFGPEVHVVSLSATGRQPTARVLWNHPRNQFAVAAFDLPPAPAGRTYQLWAIAKDKAPVSMGTFNTDPRGRAWVVLPVDPTIAQLEFVDLCGLTEEPAGGSPQPTEQPRLFGTWRHTG